MHKILDSNHPALHEPKHLREGPPCLVELTLLLHRHGDIVEDKLLGAVLTQIREQQLAREEQRLDKARTERERRLVTQRLKAAGARS